MSIKNYRGHSVEKTIGLFHRVYALLTNFPISTFKALNNRVKVAFKKPHTAELKSYKKASRHL